LFFFLSAAVGMTHAQIPLYDADADNDFKPWKELEVKLPEPPKQATLVPFDVGAATPHHFYIDAASLTVGDDGVVRYTLVVKTAGGATNVSYEGIRCETREQKYYAVGHGDGKWIPARSPEWRRVEYKDLNPHHRVLYTEFLCPARHVRMMTAKQIVTALKRASVDISNKSRISTD
jgi:CNP1-like family